MQCDVHKCTIMHKSCTRVSMIASMIAFVIAFRDCVAIAFVARAGCHVLCSFPCRHLSLCSALLTPLRLVVSLCGGLHSFESSHHPVHVAHW